MIDKMNDCLILPMQILYSLPNCMNQLSINDRFIFNDPLSLAVHHWGVSWNKNKEKQEKDTITDNHNSHKTIKINENDTSNTQNDKNNENQQNNNINNANNQLANFLNQNNSSEISKRLLKFLG